MKNKKRYPKIRYNFGHCWGCNFGTHEIVVFFEPARVLCHKCIKQDIDDPRFTYKELNIARLLLMLDTGGSDGV